jgi:hypothetical protein
MKTILSSSRQQYRAIISIFLIMLTMGTLIAGMIGCDSSSAVNIRTWYDLDDIRDSLTGYYILINDLDSTTAGYEELAGPTANGGKGWDPIGGEEFGNVFWGTFDGSGRKICDLFINRPDEIDIGLFGTVGQGLGSRGEIRNLGLVNVTVTGDRKVAALMGASFLANIVTNCYATGTVTGLTAVGGLIGSADSGSVVMFSYFDGTVTGDERVGGLIGQNWRGTMSESYSTSTVTGDERVGGLIGQNAGTISDSYSTGTVTGNYLVGGLVGISFNITSNCYSTGDVTGDERVGGLIGNDQGTVSNSYSTGNVTGDYVVGGLVGISFNVTSNCYSIGNVAGIDGYIGGLIGENQGTVSDSYSTGNVAGIDDYIGGLIGSNQGTVSNSYSTGNVTGDDHVGGLVGENDGTVSNSYSAGSVIGEVWVGGLVGDNWGSVSNSFWDIETSEQATSDGGTGKNTTEMQNIATFTDTETEGLDEPWDMIGVANPGIRSLAYIWNIVDDETYPLLSWQPVS